MTKFPAATLAVVLAAFLAVVTGGGAAQAETVLPRLSPLAEVDETGASTGKTFALAFGQPLQVLERTGPTLTVQDGQGATHRVASADVIALQSGLAAMAEPGREAGERPDLPLWDSAARGRLYLQGGAADSLRPALTETPGGLFPATGLPVFAVEAAPTSVGHPVLMAGAYVPVMPEALDPTGSAAPRKVLLHVLVDGSDYARDFTLETLKQMSRALQESGGFGGFTRQVIFEDGTTRDDGAVPAAGLRAEWPEAAKGTTDGLTAALADAMDRIADGIAPDDGAAHLVLALVGPGLVADEAALARVKQAGDRLAALRGQGADLRGIVLMQGTPEPNPANDAVLAAMAGGSATGFTDFGGDPLAALQATLTAAPAGDAASVAARREKLCALAKDRALPCVIATPGVLPPVAAADWVAMPLWFVLDGAALDLVPAGMDPKDARAAQDAIRACHAAGQVWDAATATCTLAAAPQDTDGLAEELTAVRGELATTAEARDAALEDLSRQTAEWEDQRNALQSAVDEASANLDAAQAELDARAEKIAAQEETVSAQTTNIADLTDRADALALSVSDLQTRLDQATAETARLQDDVAAREDALAAAEDQVAALTAARDAAEADLAQTRDDLASATADRDQLAQDLAAAKGAQMAAEDAFAKDRAEWQAKSDAAAQALADMTAARDQALAQVAELTTARDALQASAADLTARLAAETDARAQAETTLAQVRAEAEAAAQAAQADAAAAAATADEAARKAAAQLLAAQADYAALTAERDGLAAQVRDERARADDLAAMKASLSTSEGKIREDYATATRQLTEAQSALAAMTAERDQAAARLAEAEAGRATAEAALADAKAQLVALTDQAAAQMAEVKTQLGAERDALAAQVAQMQADAGTMTDRLAKAEAEVARLSAAQATQAASAQPAVVEDMTAPAMGVVALVNPELKPKPRPQANPPKPAKAVAKAPAKAAAKPAVKVAAAPAPEPQPLPSRRVAPASSAPQLKGCQFQWVGKEGRLVCP